VLVFASCVTAARDARADDAGATVFAASPAMVTAWVAPLVALRQPAIFPAAHGGRGPRPGWILGADTGWSTRFAEGANPASGGWGFGARAGYAFGGGFQVDARYDDLGTHLRDVDRSGVLQAATVGARYELPLYVLPFAEARVGSSFDSAAAWFAAAIAVGVAFPVARPLSVDLTVRDWFVPAGDALHSIVTVQLGFTVRFGG
jgi:hypothetical protein